MPSGNTNIMKKFNDTYDDICRNYYCSYRVKSDDESIDKFACNCEGRYEIEQQIESQQEELLKCEKFIYDLNLVLKTNMLKNPTKYVGYINSVNEFIVEYKETLFKLNDLLRIS